MGVRALHRRLEVGAQLRVRPHDEFHQLGHRRRPGVLREVGAAGPQQPGDLAPPQGNWMPAGHQVERLVGERQRGLVARHDDYHAPRMQSPGGQRRVGRPRLGGRHRRRERRRAVEHLAASGVDVQGGRRVGQTRAHQPLVAPGRSLLGRPAVQPGEIPALHVCRDRLTDQVVE